METKQDVQLLEQETKDWPNVAIIVLNWNGWQDTIECLESLQRLTYPNYQIIIVDNGSTDGSVEEIERWHVNCGGRTKNISLDIITSAKQYTSFEIAFTGFVPISYKTAEIDLTLLKSGSNLGYAGGNNVGIAWAITNGCHYALILNNDVTVEYGLVDRMVEVAKESKASVVGALVKDSHGGKVLFAKSSYPTMLFYSDQQQCIPDKKWWTSDRVDGSAMLLCRELLLERWRSRGYFLYDSLFLYCEEVELALWCRQAGKRSVVAKEAVVYHKVGASSGGKGTPLQFYYLTRNRVLLARRYLSGHLWFFFFATYPVWRIVRAGVYWASAQRQVASAIIQGLLDGYKGKTGAKP